MWGIRSARPKASEHITVSLLLQVLAAYVATSLTVGLLLGAAVGKLIRRGDRRRQEEVGLLARSRAAQAVGPRRVSPSAIRAAPIALRDDALK
jgi:hypothetical protein